MHEREGLLNTESLPNAGLVMALFVTWAHRMREECILKDSARAIIGPGYTKRWWGPHAFDNHVLAYAAKYNIQLYGAPRLDEAIKAANPEVDLPDLDAVNKKATSDPFGFKVALARYKGEHGGLAAEIAEVQNTMIQIGGDNFDITSWTTKMRKKWSLEKKDPFTEEEIEALMRGELFDLESLRRRLQEEAECDDEE